MKKHKKHKKLKKLHNVKKRITTPMQKALIVFVELALICDFSIFPLPVQAEELELIKIEEKAIPIKEKILEMETSPIEINKALNILAQKEKALEAEIQRNRERLEAEAKVFKQEQAELEQAEQDARDLATEEANKKIAEQAKRQAIKAAQVKQVKQVVQIERQELKDGVNIIKLPRGVTVYAKKPPVESKRYKVIWSDYRTFTGYNSDPWQTDDTPCIAANGFDVCKHGIEDTVAANFLKFGTKIRIPEMFGDRVFTVRDRMNRRYPNSVDIWMIYKEDARKLGRRTLKMEVVEEIK